MSASNRLNESQIVTVAVNRRALRDYLVLDRLEAGVVLQGPEVKAIRAGRSSISEAYAEVQNGEAFLEGFHVQPYEHARAENYNPLRSKKLLLHKREITRLAGQISLRGMTIIPLKLYFRRGRLKVELGICRGKRHGDKRETIRRRTAEREAERAMAVRMRRKS